MNRKGVPLYEQKSKKTAGNSAVFSAGDHTGMSDDVSALCLKRILFPDGVERYFQGCAIHRPAEL